jgi:hypothetical protein
MLSCFEAKDWDTKDCVEEINTMYACVETHKGDPVRAGERAGGGGERRRPAGRGRPRQPTAASSPRRPWLPRSHPVPLSPTGPQDPKQLVGSWQKAMRHRVFTHFVRQKVLPRLR